MSDQQASAAGQSLYTRLGGYDAVAAAVTDLMPRLRNDPKLWVYWKGNSLDSRDAVISCSSTFCAPRLAVRCFTPVPT